MISIPKFGVFMGILKSYEESKMSDLNYNTGEIADSDKVINIVVEGGMVVEVNGLPVDWQYYIDDRDCPPEIEDE
tara:strand:- start:335 stop:559 length:225 start_codon:yes stop_codon:yes gene_type:complete